MIYAEDTDSSFTLWQLPGQTNSQMNSYVIRTPGNELIVIDGGTKGDAAYLRKFIRDRGNHVHSWFITHPHLDHADALTEILNSPSELRVGKIYGSLPEDEWLQKHQDSNSLETQRTLLGAVTACNYEVIPLYLGQKIEFEEVTFEILAVRNPELTINATNNQSVVLRVEVGDKSILFLADLGVEGGEKLLASPYGNRLKADYVQMAHHGQTGVNEEFYKVVKPKFCLWPTPDWLWENDNGNGPNSGPWKTLEVRAWMDKFHIENHYVAKDGLQRIDIPTNNENKAVEQSPVDEAIKSRRTKP
jgi:beta-lactamase superfamily II metal-dependent hydrolase